MVPVFDILDAVLPPHAKKIALVGALAIGLLTASFVSGFKAPAKIDGAVDARVDLKLAPIAADVAALKSQAAENHDMLNHLDTILSDRYGTPRWQRPTK